MLTCLFSVTTIRVQERGERKGGQSSVNSETESESESEKIQNTVKFSRFDQTEKSDYSSEVGGWIPECWCGEQSMF